MGETVKNEQWTNPKLRGIIFPDNVICEIIEKGTFDHKCENYLTKANVYSAYWYKDKLYAIGSEMGEFGIKIIGGRKEN
tara:strand:- start:154 stop:390 length:237 start_codon:yes stop_codon:yes gene_type:complete